MKKKKKKKKINVEVWVSQFFVELLTLVSYPKLHDL